MRFASDQCPECAALVSRGQRIRLEFLGGEIVCDGCGAVLHLDHRWWWLAAHALGCEALLLAAFGLVVAAAVVGWWIVAVLVGAFVTAGVIVGVTSPLKVVGHRLSDGGRVSPPENI